MTTRFAFALLASFALLGATGCGKTIDSGHRGVYYNWRTGTDTKTVLGEGFQLLAPWNKIIIYDVRTKDRIEKLTLLSQDQLQIHADVSIRYRLDDRRVGELHAKVGPNFYRMLIQPVLRNTSRDVISRYQSIEAYRNRNEIEIELEKDIHEALKKYAYFTVEKVMLRGMDFPKMVVDAIERKLAMKQEADREKILAGEGENRRSAQDRRGRGDRQGPAHPQG
jgi:regulator of protease activity HflC (stomatin/prohibitin superfamily)